MNPDQHPHWLPTQAEVDRHKSQAWDELLAHGRHVRLTEPIRKTSSDDTWLLIATHLLAALSGAMMALWSLG
jgi:hypothetical protein